MSKERTVSILELSDKIIKSYGFFILINEGKTISVITDDKRNLSMLSDYLIEHPDVLNEILERIASHNASLN